MITRYVYYKMGFRTPFLSTRAHWPLPIDATTTNPTKTKKGQQRKSHAPKWIQRRPTNSHTNSLYVEDVIVRPVWPGLLSRYVVHWSSSSEADLTHIWTLRRFLMTSTWHSPEKWAFHASQLNMTVCTSTRLQRPSLYPPNRRTFFLTLKQLRKLAFENVIADKVCCDSEQGLLRFRTRLNAIGNEANKQRDKILLPKRHFRRSSYYRKLFHQRLLQWEELIKASNVVVIGEGLSLHGFWAYYRPIDVHQATYEAALVPSTLSSALTVLLGATSEAPNEGLLHICEKQKPLETLDPLFKSLNELRGHFRDPEFLVCTAESAY